MKQFSSGLVVGKFCPLHRGHERVIRRALELCEHVTVISYTQPEFPGCEPEKREQWLAALFPQTRRLVVTEKRLTDFAHTGSFSPLVLPQNDDSDFTHRLFVARLCAEILHQRVDAVFTSEDYGDGFAAELSRLFHSWQWGGGPVHHHRVDVHREAVPISGTELRRDPHAGKAYLSPEVYASFVERIALLGGESSGKSTLAALLAERLGTMYAPEYGRERWEEKAGRLEFSDLLHIAEVQCAREERLAGQSHRYLVCDTTPLTTLYYSQHLFSRVDPKLQTQAQRPYAHTFLCLRDFPFVEDGTRADATFADHQEQWYRHEFATRQISHVSLGGDLPTRIETAVRALTRKTVQPNSP